MNSDIGIVHTNRRLDGVFLRYHTTQTPSLSNMPVGMTPPGNHFKGLLHVILPKKGLAQRLPLCLQSWHPPRRHERCEKSATASRVRPFPHQLSESRPVIGISSLPWFPVTNWFDSPVLTQFNSQFPNLFDWLVPTLFDSCFLLDSAHSFWLDLTQIFLLKMTPV